MSNITEPVPAPYPAELSEAWETDGEPLTIRPIRPEDAKEHQAFFHRLSPEDIRYRFFAPLRELSAERMARMTQVDYRHEMAFIAQRQSDGETVGVARLVSEDDPASAEFAIIVQSDSKGKGVGTHLLHRLIDWARGQGIREIFGLVLADNRPMLAFVRSLGFTLHHRPGGGDVLDARLRLE